MFLVLYQFDTYIGTQFIFRILLAEYSNELKQSTEIKEGKQ